MWTFKCSYGLLSKTSSVLYLRMSSIDSWSKWYFTVYRPESQCSSKFSTNILLNPFTILSRLPNSFYVILRCRMNLVISTTTSVYWVQTVVIGAVLSCSVLRSMNAAINYHTLFNIGLSFAFGSPHILAILNIPSHPFVSLAFGQSVQVLGTSPSLLLEPINGLYMQGIRTWIWTNAFLSFCAPPVLSLSTD